MSATESIVEPEQASANALRLLYICDFPPCNCHGGAILMSRLLEGSAGAHLLVMTSTPGMRLSKEGDLLDCKHIAFPVLGASRIRWFGRFKHILNWIILAVACCTAISEHSLAEGRCGHHGTSRTLLLCCRACRISDR